MLPPAEIAAFAHLKYASYGIKDIGRITTWPEKKMYEQRSISWKTADVDERQLLILLFSALEDQEDKSKERLTELRAAHSDEFRRMFHR